MMDIYHCSCTCTTHPSLEYTSTDSTHIIKLVLKWLPAGEKFKGIEWKYAYDLCECGTKETEMHVFLSENAMDVIKGYVEWK